ncbi:hypothetical protein CC80DRAFT_509441 [Byssothecium circinans]|uniref:Uncharacterized protein n=1 Tax=Byssothecium circinans TaxID=147558 RepID=A0A6A5TFV6_9PLEO|nr:hypothetical protein CC80DRAFT_509441 [Byssothecium circinans]
MFKNKRKELKGKTYNTSNNLIYLRLSSLIDLGSFLVGKYFLLVSTYSYILKKAKSSLLGRNSIEIIKKITTLILILTLSIRNLRRSLSSTIDSVDNKQRSYNSKRINAEVN